MIKLIKLFVKTVILVSKIDIFIASTECKNVFSYFNKKLASYLNGNFEKYQNSIKIFKKITCRHCIFEFYFLTKTQNFTRLQSVKNFTTQKTFCVVHILIVNLTKNQKKWKKNPRQHGNFDHHFWSKNGEKTPLLRFFFTRPNWGSYPYW